MHCTWKARFGVTAAFVGGFWLLGQATAQADETDTTGSLESVSSIVSGTGDTEAIAVSEADGGDGGDAESNQEANDNGGNTALLTGNNVTVGGNACLLAKCETQQDVDNDSDNATTDIDQTAVNVGGDGGDATSTSTAKTYESRSFPAGKSRASKNKKERDCNRESSWNYSESRR